MTECPSLMCLTPCVVGGRLGKGMTDGKSNFDFIMTDGRGRDDEMSGRDKEVIEGTLDMDSPSQVYRMNRMWR